MVSKPRKGHTQPILTDAEALKSMLIIPRTPTLPPLEERDVTTLSHAELKELQRIAQEHKVRNC